MQGMPQSPSLSTIQSSKRVRISNPSTSTPTLSNPRPHYPLTPSAICWQPFEFSSILQNGRPQLHSRNTRIRPIHRYAFLAPVPRNNNTYRIGAILTTTKSKSGTYHVRQNKQSSSLNLFGTPPKNEWASFNTTIGTINVFSDPLGYSRTIQLRNTRSPGQSTTSASIPSWK